MASLTHQWLLCLFATEVVKILYHCCLPLPSNLHFHFLPSALLPPPPPLTTCCSLLSKDVKPVTPYHFGLWPQSCEYACAVCPYTQLFVCHSTSQQTGIFRNKFQSKHCEPYFLFPFPTSFVCRIFPFSLCSHFCFVLSPLGCISRPLRCKFSQPHVSHCEQSLLIHAFLFFSFFPCSLAVGQKH